VSGGPVPAIAVIGHTNTGKTSLMRTLTRQRDFGAISAHPATTRHVELAELAVDGESVLRLYDTPGFEDSSGLLAHIERLKAARGEDWLETIRAFAGDLALQAGFGQEAKALRQILASDVLLYVVDLRDPVRGKLRDELELIGRCGRPLLPVLNFLGQDGAREDLWREQLARLGLHAVAAFDTVVYREADELALYAKIATLADRFEAPLQALTAELAAARAALRRASALIVAELAVDVAAAHRRFRVDDADAEAVAAETLKEAVRRREQEAVDALLRLHRFDRDDYAACPLPIAHGRWQQDLFDAAALERFALDSGKALAAGATAGLAIDLMTGGLSLGVAALLGASAGLAIDTVRRYGGRLKALAEGTSDMTLAEATVLAMVARDAALVSALMGRGHGALAPIPETALEGEALHNRLAHLIREARRHPDWSTLTQPGAGTAASAQRGALARRIAEQVEALTSDARPAG